ncbi:MAG: UDP-2,3-diacylglucosamine diphosphatase [Cellvibrionaceae bacterium]
MIYFISDLHLSPQRPEITQAFYYFLKNIAHDAEQLYILGDFFDAWVGDDDDTPLFREIEQALLHFNNAKIGSKRIYFMHGNRDFMVGSDFAERTGVTLLDDPTLIDLNGNKTLLMHGDSLCTLDQEYMAFRQTVRNPAWQKEILKKPLEERLAIAAQMQATSQSMNSIKAEDIMDVTPEEVVKTMEENKTTLLIHGHTHRPDRHTVELNHHVKAERIVLGDWHHKAWYLVATDNAIELKQLNLLDLAFRE